MIIDDELKNYVKEFSDEEVFLQVSMNKEYFIVSHVCIIANIL